MNVCAPTAGRYICRRHYATELKNVALPSRPPPRVPPLPPSRFIEDVHKQEEKASLENAVSPAMANDLREILSNFRAPIRCAIGYGSGVFKQANYAADAKPMLDLIFAVSHPAHWHDINRQQNPSHYSLLSKVLGSSFVGWAQENLGAGVWFNVDCLVNGRRIKYGVVSTDTLCADLLDWQTLYIAGRMQKPTAVIKQDPRVRLANQVNLLSALRTALLLLPSEFHQAQLYEKITSLSYMGDPRMRMAENPRKVQNIVSAQEEHFHSMYSPLMPADILHQRSGGVWTQDLAPRTRAELAIKLPGNLKRRVKASFGSTSDPSEQDSLLHAPKTGEKEFWVRTVQDARFQSTVEEQLGLIVGKAATRQSLKGILSVGPIKGAKYVWPKVKKRFGG